MSEVVFTAEGLTRTQDRFVDAFLKTFSVTAAALEAGEATNAASAAATGSKWLKTPKIKAVLRQRHQRLKSKEKMSPDWVVKQLRRVVERCLQAVPVTDNNGKVTGIWSFNAAGTVSALKILAQNFDMLSPEVVVNVDMNLDSRLHEARERMARRLHKAKELLDITAEANAITRQAGSRAVSVSDDVDVDEVDTARIATSIPDVMADVFTDI